MEQVKSPDSIKYNPVIASEVRAKQSPHYRRGLLRSFLSRNDVLFFYVLILIFIAGCIEKIEFETKPGQQLLVVDGQITQSVGPQTLRLSRSAPLGQGAPTPVTNAQVTIFDELGHQENYFETEAGLYLLSGHTVQGREGGTYYIEIRLDENTVYRSQPETMPPLVEADSVYFRLDKETELNDLGNAVEIRTMKIFVDTPVKKAGKDCLFRWRMLDTYSVTDLSCGPLDPPTTCYITEEGNPQNIPLFNSLNISSDRLEGFLVASNPFVQRYTYFGRHYYNVIQYSITREAYDYWGKINTIANQEGTIFDPPPAAVSGNIFNVNNKTELVLGYFEATAVDTVRNYSFRHDFPDISIPAFCTFGSMPRNTAACCTCQVLENSTLEEPDYWDKE